MAAIIEYRLPTEGFALEETLTTHPEAQIEIERVVADDPEQITPYVWVHADDFAAFEAALEDDPTVEDVTMFSEMEDERSSRSDSIDDRRGRCGLRCCECLRLGRCPASTAQ